MIASAAAHLTTLLAVTPSPTPTTEFDENTVTPGPIGFLVVFGVALVAVLLILDMVRRVRRTTYREQIREELEREARGDSEDETAGPRP
jgi:heme exporter protein D